MIEASSKFCSYVYSGTLSRLLVYHSSRYGMCQLRLVPLAILRSIACTRCWHSVCLKCERSLGRHTAYRPCRPKECIMPSRADLIVFSHLPWNFVYQRPQHLLSRLAATYRVIFIQEPVQHDGPPSWEYTEPQPTVVVARPQGLGNVI